MENIKLLGKECWLKKTFNDLRGSVIMTSKYGGDRSVFHMGETRVFARDPLKNSSSFAVIDHYGSTRCAEQAWLLFKLAEAVNIQRYIYIYILD